MTERSFASAPEQSPRQVTPDHILEAAHEEANRCDDGETQRVHMVGGQRRELY